MKKTKKLKISNKKKLLLLIIFAMFFSASFCAYKSWKEMDIIKIVWRESRGFHLRHNKPEDARGLMQIRPCVLQEWNEFHPKDSHTPAQLFIAHINIKIGTWYFQKRCPQMLRAYNIPDTKYYKVICYNAGISRAIQHYRDGRKLPPITEKYLKGF